MKKQPKNCCDKVYLVWEHSENVIAVFSSKNGAERFIKRTMRETGANRSKYFIDKQDVYIA